MNKWKTYPIGGAANERMTLRGLKCELSHAVAVPCDSQEKALCGVKTRSLCMDDSLATDELPECPRCRKKIEAMPAGNDAGVTKIVYWYDPHERAVEYGFRKAAESRAEPIVTKIVYWYDRHTRSWVVAAKDANNNQVGEADYSGDKLGRDFAIRNFLALNRIKKAEKLKGPNA